MPTNPWRSKYPARACQSVVLCSSGMEGDYGAGFYGQDLRDRVIDAVLARDAGPAGGGGVRDRDRRGDCGGAPGARKR